MRGNYFFRKIAYNAIAKNASISPPITPYTTTPNNKSTPVIPL